MFPFSRRYKSMFWSTLSMVVLSSHSVFAGSHASDDIVHAADGFGSIVVSALGRYTPKIPFRGALAGDAAADEGLAVGADVAETMVLLKAVPPQLSQLTSYKNVRMVAENKEFMNSRLSGGMRLIIHANLMNSHQEPDINQRFKATVDHINHSLDIKPNGQTVQISIGGGADHGQIHKYPSTTVTLDTATSTITKIRNNDTGQEYTGANKTVYLFGLNNKAINYLVPVLYNSKTQSLDIVTNHVIELSKVSASVNLSDTSHPINYPQSPNVSYSVVSPQEYFSTENLKNLPD
jgi:hypothetical protein